MTLTFVFLLLLGLPYLNGQNVVEFDSFRLRFTFHPSYNTYHKSCCKLYPGACYPLLDTLGYTCDSLRGRVTKTVSDGCIEFKISKAQLQDGGHYRCQVLGVDYVFMDFYVQITEATYRRRLSQPLRTTTINAVKSSTSVPSSSTGSVLMQEDQSSSWITSPTLIVVVSILAATVVAAVVCIVCFKKTTKNKQSDKHGETLCESLKRDTVESASVVYTTVNFTAHQKSSGVYENFSKTRSGSPDSEHPDRVEYSTLAVHQRTTA